jgi:TIGR03009 family protein
MRPYGLVLTALFSTGVLATAQTPPAAKTPPASAAPSAAQAAAAQAAAAQALDRHLLRWEQKMREVQTLSAQLTRLDKDKVFTATQKYTGFAQYMKSGTGPSALNLGLLELRLDGKADLAEKIVCTGTYLYQFMPAQKEIRAIELPRPKAGQVADDNFLSFLFGMKAEEAKRRYVLTLAKEDTWYIYVDVAPRFPADKADFQRARLVLNKDNFLPRQLWFEHGNGNETTWDIPRLQAGAALDRRNFDAPKPPPGWKLVAVKREAPPAAAPPPRVVRPGSR